MTKDPVAIDCPLCEKEITFAYLGTHFLRHHHEQYRAVLGRPIVSPDSVVSIVCVGEILRREFSNGTIKAFLTELALRGIDP